MRVIGNKELEEQEVKESELLAEAIDESSIASYIMDCWTKAKNFKEQGAEQQILKNMRQIDGQYESDKMAAIKEIGGSEVYMMITDAKCKNAKDWANELIFQSSNRPFGINPSPIPDLPDFVKQEIGERALRSVIEMVAAQAPQVLTDRNAMVSILQESMPQVEEEVKAQIAEEAKKISEKLEKAVDDKLIEGGWYEAMRDVTTNVVMHTGILKGPVLKKRKLQKVVTGDNGILSTQVIEDIIPTYESRHPLYIYPAPGSTDVNDGYLFDRIKITPMKLQELIGVPGYDEEELLAVLKEAGDGALRNWLNLQVDQDISDLNDEISTVAYDSDKIDCLEFWGYVFGDKILEWGLKTDGDGKPVDENMYYNISAYLIHNHVIRIQFNIDPLGRKPFYRASFEDREGSFWGKGLPEIISDCQQTCNAVARAIVNNAGMASGPQVERNIDRIPAAVREDNKLIPWKVWDVTDSMMVSNSPALKFYQPPMVVERLMGIYTSFSKIADEHSGVPAYAHGDPQVGGAGNTASGLSMLMSSSARGIKALVNSIDHNITQASVLRQYHMIVEEQENFGLICDYNVVTLGSTAAVQKEQLAARRMEFMNNTANPVDMQIIGLDGRKYMLEETARSLQFDMNKLFPPTQPPPPEQIDAPGNAGEPGAKGRTLDAAGNPAQGTDVRTAGGRGGDGGAPIQRRQEGGPVEEGEPYIVGEGGRELFVPAEDGVIIPNDRLNNMASGRGYGGFNAPNMNPDIGVTYISEANRANHPASFGRSELTPQEQWESHDDRVTQILGHFLTRNSGDVDRALDEVMMARKYLPADLGLRNAEYYLWGRAQTRQGANPIGQEIMSHAYSGLKRALPDEYINRIMGEPAGTRVTTPLGGQTEWNTRGIRDASRNINYNNLGFQPEDFS